jgi:acetyl esterase/lipase
MSLHFFLATFMLTSVIACQKTTDPPGDIVVPSQKDYYDIPYAGISTAQKLDVFLPDTGTAPYPVVVWIHGGGWQSGDKAQFRTTPMMAALQSRGYAVVVINYRLSAEAIFPAQIHDVKAAIRWVKANAASYAINKNNIGVWGSSAGGHLSALAGTSAGVTELESPGLGNSGFSSAVQVVVDWYGPANILQLDSMALAQGCVSSNHNAANSPESLLIGYQITTRPDLAAKVNPAAYISSDDPPFFIEHGLTDCTVASGQSQYLFDQLLPVIGPQKLKLKFLANTGHGGGLFSDATIIAEAIDFFDLYLK